MSDILTNEKSEMRGKIESLENVMREMTGQQIHIEPKHYFCPNIYMREISIPKGVTLTGKIHKTEHFCILSKGKVSVWTDEGMKELEASSVVHSMPGIKRVLYAHEDSVWVNVHHNPENEKDLEKIEDYFVTENFESFLEFEKQKLLEAK